VGVGEENVRTYCIVLLCSLSAGCACVFHLVLVSCVDGTVLFGIVWDGRKVG
jgi:hypothetical protein